MRTLLAALLISVPVMAQMPPNQNFAPPAPFPPDAATLAKIKAKTAELKTAVEMLKPKDRILLTQQNDWADVAVYLKAAEWIVRHNEWYSKDSGKQTLAALDAGLIRAEALKAGKTPWREVRNKAIIRGYVSTIDFSVQPYSVSLPNGFGAKGKEYSLRYDVVLHGRNATLTEAGFIGGKELAKPQVNTSDVVVLEVYGRGNNAFRWSGERDVFEAMNSFESSDDAHRWIDPWHTVIRGFSMGGAGTWHIGLHQPFKFHAMSPGAGFTVTRGYVKNFAPQPDYIERCLHIYDAADYAENLVNIPCVAYSGEIDPQRAAVTNIEARLKDFKEKLRYTHIIGTGLEHKQPPEWWAKVDAQLRKELATRSSDAWKQSRFVTYTTRYNDFGMGHIESLARHYDRAVVDVRIEGGVGDKKCVVKSENITAMQLTRGPLAMYKQVVIDGQTLAVEGDRYAVPLKKTDGRWEIVQTLQNQQLQKMHGLQGPIDDAFMTRFKVVIPENMTASGGIPAALHRAADQFARTWNKYFRGELPALTPNGAINSADELTLVYFGDPQSNPALASAMKHLPIQWDAQKLVVDGKTYDAKTHYPVMIYPTPRRNNGQTRYYYAVLNSGHTFGEDALKGTNALLYPRLGDWAVMKLAPTKENPHATEVAAAGIFDENWQFEKKK